MRRVKAVIFLLVYLDYLEFSRDVDYGLYVFLFSAPNSGIFGQIYKKVVFSC